ncbi:Mediator of RNA polymerase II transcription subunit 19a [Capsicum annuum]|nr:Mediator of RNA polymerase II transcription subunit 19a [Capsicum annuum]KAF3650794.1 Mediator of RNA polymerase II transcription subunit 19a [Capsicum annuum]
MPEKENTEVENDELPVTNAEVYQDMSLESKSIVNDIVDILIQLHTDDVESITIDANIIELEAQTEYKVEVDYSGEDFDQENDTMNEYINDHKENEELDVLSQIEGIDLDLYKDSVSKSFRADEIAQGYLMDCIKVFPDEYHSSIRAKRIYRYCGFYFSFQVIAYHDFFCKKPLSLSIFDTHYLHNMVGDTEIRKGKGMQLDQLIQHASSLKETNLHIQPFDLDALREAFRLRESKKEIHIVAGKSKSESKNKEKKHKKHKDKDKENDKEHKKHKHLHKDRSKDKDKEKKKDRTVHHDSGAELSSGWRTWRNMARPFGYFASSTQGCNWFCTADYRVQFVLWINYPEWKSGSRDSLKMEANNESKDALVDDIGLKSETNSDAPVDDTRPRELTGVMDLTTHFKLLPHFHQGGVQRVHLLDDTIGGVLLKELFQRNGVGMMVASDLYEGAWMARVSDIPGLKELLQPLEGSGTLIRRTDEELVKELPSFVIVETEGHIIACAALFPYFEEKYGKVTAIAVSPDCYSQGQGDKLLGKMKKQRLCEEFTEYPETGFQEILEIGRLHSIKEFQFPESLLHRWNGNSGMCRDVGARLNFVNDAQFLLFSPTSEHLLLTYGHRHGSLLKIIVIDGDITVPVYTILEVPTYALEG